MTHTQDDIDALENRIYAMQEALDRAAGSRHSEGEPDVRDVYDLIKTIHRPGWTTVAELRLFNALVDSITAHAEAVAGMRAALIAAGPEIGA
jgi:hypothetical protein